MMRPNVVAAFALLAPVSLAAQSIADQSTATPLPGNWTYATTEDGSQTVFTDANNQPQLSLRCLRSIRRVVVSKPATAAAPTLTVWSSTATKSFPATYDAATARVSAQIANWDPILDALAYSRGRIAIATNAQQLVVPSCADISRIVEDCRA